MSKNQDIDNVENGSEDTDDNGQVTMNWFIPALKHCKISLSGAVL